MTSPAVVLDASVLIGAMQPRDAHHAAARSILRRGAAFGALLAHPLTIAESAVGAALAGDTERLRSAYAGLGIHSLPTDEDAPWRLARLRASTGLPMPDCCVLDSALEAGAALATFDQRLAHAAASAGVDVINT